MKKMYYRGTALILILMAFLLAMNGLRRRDEALVSRLAPEVLRFHVLANSNTPEDQALKLAVKDYLLEEIRMRLSNAEDSLSKEFNSKQIYLVEDVINEISKNDVEKLADFNAQICRYSCFMCFAILASAAEGNHFKSIKTIKENIKKSLHNEKIQRAEFENISLKSKISIFLMKKKCYKTAFYFLNLCKNIKRIIKKG